MKTSHRLSCSVRGLLARCALFITLASLMACEPQLTSTVVQLDGRAIELVDTGAGPVTVVFEAGLGDDWTTWNAVASQVASDARVFAYSRPGYGHSDATDSPRDAATIVQELRTLLSRQGIAPPYVLVGHSFGGTYMELFAKAYPREVVGVVLVDTRPRDFAVRCEQAGLSGCTIPEAALASLPKVQRDEYLAFARSADQIAPLGGFGNYPVRVLTAGTHSGFSPAVEALWTSLHASLGHEAADGKQTVFAGAGHYLQEERSEDVAAAILGLIPSAK